MAHDLLLFAGPKIGSTWTLRAWLILKHYGIPFDEQLFDYNTDDGFARLKQESPSGWVPVLWHDGKPIWDTLSIAEYLNELFPEHQMWPSEPRARAVARSVAAEMHSSFGALRVEMPMIFGEKHTISPSDACKANIARIENMWTDCRAEFGADGPFLFGDFSIADAMYAPVVSRFRTYGVESDSASVTDYRNAIWNLPAMQAWGAGAISSADG